MASLIPLLTFLAGAIVSALICRAVFRRPEDGAITEELRRVQATQQATQIENAALNERVRLLDELKEELAEKDRLILSFREEKAKLDQQIAIQQKAFEEQKQLISNAEQRFVDTINSLASEALRKNNSSFLELAKDQLSNQFEKKEQAIGQMIKPLEEKLGKLDEQTRLLEEKRVGAYASLNEQVKALYETQTRLETGTRNLISALRNPSQRGQWGEIQLRRVVEMAGMIKYCDFFEQVDSKTEDGRLRPDMVVRLPGNRTIVVDSKTAMEAYMKSLNCDDDATRTEFIVEHAQQVRKHITQLSAKSYWEQFRDTPDFVVLFLPGEPLFTAALEQDPSLIEFGTNNNVLIATPMTLIALLRAVAHGWRQEQLNENAQKISELGRELYKRIRTLGEHVARLGRNLDSAVENYNKAVGSMESQVLTQARRFKELGSATTDEIGELAQVEKRCREFQKDELGSPSDFLSLAGSDGESNQTW